MRGSTYTVALALGALFVGLFSVAAPAGNDDDGLRFEADLSGAQEVPAVATGMSGEVEADFDDAFTRVEVKLEVQDISSPVVAAHFHCARPGENGPVAFGLFSPGPLTFEVDDDEGTAEGVLTNDDFTGADCVPNIGRPVNNIVALAFAMREGLIYANVHTVAVGSGEIRGQLGLRSEFEADLSGAQEVPAVATGMQGEVEVEFDDAFTLVDVELEVTGITGTVVAAHFHCGFPGQNGPIAFGLFSPGPLTFEVDDDEGTAEGVLTNDDFTGADCVPVIGRPVNNIAALALAMQDGLIYANVHTVAVGSGEIRGQLAP